MLRQDMDLRIGLCTTATNITKTRWSRGEIKKISGHSISEINTAIESLITSNHMWICFWDHTTCELPSENEIIRIISETRADAIHNTPHAFCETLRQFFISVEPLHLFYSHVDDAIKTISWETTFGLMLVRTSLFQCIGTFPTHFDTSNAATLAWGRHALRQGAIVEQEPRLPSPIFSEKLTYREMFSIIKSISGMKWTIWAAVYACLSHPTHIPIIVSCMMNSRKNRVHAVGALHEAPFNKTNLRAVHEPTLQSSDGCGISVIIPSLHRYKNLRETLTCIRHQTLKPREIIVVDQESDSNKVRDIFKIFSDLPLRMISLASPGQCRSRNAGIRAATQPFLMLMDDDNEAPDDLLEKLWHRLQETSADAVCGIYHETSAAPQDHLMGQVLASDVMPGGNVLIRRSILEKSGLFDLAYDKLSRADADLALRIHQNGGLIILDRSITILHHHAQQGGLRHFGARKITNAIARRSYFKIRLLSPSEIYQAKRFFLHNSSACLIVQRLLATLYVTDHPHPLLRCLAGMISLPFSLIAIGHAWWLGKKLLKNYPKIPMLSAASLDLH